MGRDSAWLESWHENTDGYLEGSVIDEKNGVFRKNFIDSTSTYIDWNKMNEFTKPHAIRDGTLIIQEKAFGVRESRFIYGRRPIIFGDAR